MAAGACCVSALTTSEGARRARPSSGPGVGCRPARRSRDGSFAVKLHYRWNDLKVHCGKFCHLVVGFLDCSAHSLHPALSLPVSCGGVHSQTWIPRLPSSLLVYLKRRAVASTNWSKTLNLCIFPNIHLYTCDALLCA